MATFLETFQAYQKFLSDRKRKPETIRGISLSLSYFIELYGNMETADVTLSDVKLFFEMLQKRRKKKKNSMGDYSLMSNAFVHKVMKHLKAFFKRLNEKGQIKNITPLDIPTIKHVAKHPKYLTETEMSLLFQQLEKDLGVARKCQNQ